MDTNLRNKKKIEEIDQMVLDLDFHDELLPGVKAITLLRRHIYDSELTLHKMERRNTTAKGFIYFRDVIFFSLLSAIHILFLISKKENPKFLLIGLSRRVFSKGKWRDPTFDLFIENYRSELFILERPFKGRHRVKFRNDEAVFFIDILHYLEFIIAKIISPFVYIYFRKKIYHIRPKLSLISDNSIKLEKKLCFALGSVIIQTLLATLILRLLRPEALLLVNRWLNFGFIRAARQLKIPIVEFQHGAVKSISSYYKSYDDGDLNVDIIGTFSDYWNGRPWGNCERVVVGKSLIDFRSPLANKANSCCSNNNILFISQPDIGLELLNDVKELSQNNTEFNFFLKFHPQERDRIKFYQQALSERKNVEISDHLIDQDYAMVIGYSSTLLFEFSDLGYPVVSLVSPDLDCDIPFSKIKNHQRIFDLNKLPTSEIFFERPSFNKLNQSLALRRIS